MKLRAFSETHTGHRRSINQDSLIIDKQLSLFAVADGMGGHSSGEVASALAIESLKEYLKQAVKKSDFHPEKSLVEACQRANFDVFQKSQDESMKYVGMGTTLVACMIWENKAYFANVGDSRAYLFRDPYLWRITEDHSVMNMQIKKGLIEESQAAYLADSNVITRSIGFFPEIQVDLFCKDLHSEDLFLLCSDGLNEIPDEDICLLAKSYAPEALAEQCLKKVLDGEASDNISVVVIAP